MWDIVQVGNDVTEWRVDAIELDLVRLSRSYINDAGNPVIVSATVSPEWIRLLRKGTPPPKWDGPELTVRPLSQPEIKAFTESNVRLSWTPPLDEAAAVEEREQP
jgi:hypothetical protein